MIEHDGESVQAVDQTATYAGIIVVAAIVALVLIRITLEKR